MRNTPANKLRFIVHRVFDMKTQGRCVVSGRLAQGDIQEGTVLNVQATNVLVSVKGIEFPNPRKDALNLVFDQEAASVIKPGQCLIGTGD